MLRGILALLSLFSLCFPHRSGHFQRVLQKELYTGGNLLYVLLRGAASLCGVPLEAVSQAKTPSPLLLQVNRRSFQSTVSHTLHQLWLGYKYHPDLCRLCGR